MLEIIFLSCTLYTNQVLRMLIHADKNQGDRNKHQETRKENAESNRFASLVDQRPQAVLQAKLQAIADKSPKVKQLQASENLAERTPLPSSLVTSHKTNIAAQQGLPKFESTSTTHSTLQLKKSQVAGNGALAYHQSLANGRAKWNLLNAQLDQYFSKDSNLLIEHIKAKRAEFDARWNTYYKTKYIEKDGAIEAHTRGVKAQNEPNPHKLPYFNKLHPKTNTIEAVAVYAEKDEARDTDHGLKSSEIMWQQYLSVIMNQYRYQSKELAMQKMKEIERSQISQVTTPATRLVVEFAYPDGEQWINKHGLQNGVNKKWFPYQEEFFAILGTQNVMPTVWLLIDHMDELNGKTISSIDTITEGEIIAVNLNTDWRNEWENSKFYLGTDLESQWENSKTNLIPKM